MIPNMRYFKGEVKVGAQVVLVRPGWPSTMMWDGEVCAVFVDQAAVKLEQGCYVVSPKDRLRERALTQLPNGEYVFSGDRVYGSWRGAGKSGFVVDQVNSSGHLCCSGMVLTSDATQLSLTQPVEAEEYVVLLKPRLSLTPGLRGPYTYASAYAYQQRSPGTRMLVKLNWGN